MTIQKIVNIKSCWKKKIKDLLLGIVTGYSVKWYINARYCAVLLAHLKRPTERHIAQLIYK